MYGTVLNSQLGVRSFRFGMPGTTEKEQKPTLGRSETSLIILGIMTTNKGAMPGEEGRKGIANKRNLQAIEETGTSRARSRGG